MLAPVPTLLRVYARAEISMDSRASYDDIAEASAKLFEKFLVDNADARIVFKCTELRSTPYGLIVDREMITDTMEAVEAWLENDDEWRLTTLVIPYIVGVTSYTYLTS